VRTKSQLGWLNLLHLPMLRRQWLPKQVVTIPGNRPEDGIDGCEEKYFEKGKVSGESGKC